MQANTLKDLADHCYEKWLKTPKADLPSGAIKWIGVDLGEPELAGQVKEIFASSIKPSEKCYRFLKLTGVIERERLIKLLRKQTVDELEDEKAQQLRDIENNYQREIDDQWQKTFNKPAENSYPFIVFAIIPAIICGWIGAAGGGRLGWAIGLFVGTSIAYFYRAWRANDGVRQWREQRRGAVDKDQAAKESNIQEQVRNIDEYIPHLINDFSAPLSESAKKNRGRTRDITAGQPVEEIRGNLRGQYAGLVVFIGCLMLAPAFFGSHNTTKRDPLIEQVPTYLEITRSVIAESLDSNSNPVGIDTNFFPGNRELTCYVSYTGGIPNKTSFIFNWFKNGNEIGSSNVTLIYPSGNAWSNLNFDFQPGNYEVKLYAGGHQIKTINFEVVEPQVVQQSQISVDRSGMAEGLDSNKNPIGIGTTFSPGNKTLHYWFHYTGAIQNQTVFQTRLLKNGSQVGDAEFKAPYMNGTHSVSYNQNFEPGNYQGVLYADGQEINITSFEISEAQQEVFRPSFNCANATTPAERLICSNQALAQADSEMAELYNRVLRNTRYQDTLRREQNIWREKDRDVCRDVPSMLNVYQKRISRLSNWENENRDMSEKETHDHVINQTDFYRKDIGRKKEIYKNGGKTDASGGTKRFDKDIPLIP